MVDDVMAYKSLAEQISEMEHGLSDLRARQKSDAAIPDEAKRIATMIHTKFCHWNHTDGCSWLYEKDNWAEFAHAEWLDKAKGLMAVGFDAGKVEAFIKALSK